MTPEQLRRRRQLAEQLRERNIVIDAVYVPIPAPHQRNTMANVHRLAEAQTPAPALPPDPKKAWASILDALALPADATIETVDEAFGALSQAMQAELPPSPEAVAALGRLYGLSEREQRMFCEPRHKAGTIATAIKNYAAAKAAMKRTSR